jgi:DNA-binding transcriptional LysR family regulator
VQNADFAVYLPVFVDAARLGSFSAAARAHAMTPSAIARQVDALEAAIGARLFVRSTRALRLTDAGRLLLERAATILDALTDAKAEIAAAEGGVSGVLRLACLPTFGKRYIMPAADLVMQRHPQLRIELDLTERLADPVGERMDAVIRVGAQRDSSLLAVKLGSQRMTMCASPDYLARAGAPLRPQELAEHRLLDKLHGADLLGWREVMGAGAGPLIARQSVYRCDDFEALRDAACRGFGLARLPDWVVWEDLASGRLSPVPLGPTPAAGEDILLLRPPFEPAAKLRIFIETLRDQIGRPPVWERGRLEAH